MVRLFILFSLILSFSFTVYTQVNQFDVTDKGFGGDPQKTGQDSSGNIVVIWQDIRDAWYFLGNEPGSAIYGQIYTPDLNPSGPNFRISEPVENGISIRPDMLVLPDGRFIVAWKSVRDEEDPEEELYDSTRRIVMTIMNIHGEVVQREKTVNDNPGARNVAEPKIALLPGNRFLIHWWSPLKDGAVVRYGQYFEYDGTPIGGNFRLNPEGIETSTVHVEKLDEERYSMFFNRRNHNVAMVIYGSDLQPQSEVIHVESYEERYGSQRAFVYSPDTLIVVYNVLEAYQLSLYFTNLAGEIISDAVPINDDGTIYPKGHVRFARDRQDGTFILVWDDFRNGSFGQLSFIIGDIYGQRYERNGNPVGSNFKVNHEPREMDQRSSNIIFINGKYLVSWYEDRTIMCPPPPAGTVTMNFGEWHIVARTLDFNDPQPGPVIGLEDYLRACELYAIPNTLELYQNYPNPFNTSTTISFEVYIQFVHTIKIEIYDILGRRVAVPVDGRFGRGRYEIPFDASDLSSGVYILRMTSDQKNESAYIKRMLLIR